jgi:hypothetical protein
MLPMKIPAALSLEANSVSLSGAASEVSRVKRERSKAAAEEE